MMLERLIMSNMVPDYASVIILSINATLYHYLFIDKW